MLFFKRIAGAFRGVEEREWLLLSLDVLGVMAGILIAFELNEWAARRNQASQDRERLERLFEEARTNVAQLRGEREVTRKMTEVEVNFASSLTDAGTCPAADQWDAVATINMYPTIAVRSSVYDEVIGAGGLSSIRSPKAREAVNDFHSLLTWSQGQNEGFRRASSPAVPVDDPRVTVRYDTKAQEPEVFSYDRAVLCADKRFRNRMADRVRDHQSIYNFRSDLTHSAIKMCASLGALLGKECTPSDGTPLQGDDLRTAQAAAAEVRSDR